MYTVYQTPEFADWLDDLKDVRAQVRIAARLRQAEAGNLGDHKNLSGSLSEMRLDIGPGYRLYFTRRDRILVVMLMGGDKSTQERDIAKARRLLTSLELDL
jgi:putative addiction module killer protein